MMRAKKRWFVLLACILIVSMVFAVGCGSKEKDIAAEQETQSEEQGQETTKIEIPKKVMAVGSASSGSLFVTYTAAWADMLMKQIPGLNITVEPGGSSQNMQSIHNGETEFGITSTFQTYPGYYGLDWAEGTKYDHVNSLFPAYSYEGVFFTTKEHSDINSIHDLDGKIVSFGYAGGGSDFTGRALIDFFGIKPKNIVNASWSDVGGMIAVVWWMRYFILLGIRLRSFRSWNCRMS